MYRIRVEIYTQQSAVVHPLYNVPRFLYNENTWTVSSFNVKFDLDFVFYYVYSYFCINSYVIYENVNILMKMNMKLQECIINLIECIWSLDRWKDIDAQWFQQCKQSN